ncbi:MAG: hypothetical protein HQ536_05430 [Parcubacteria group bacterium]|nr:hypothetical protein [Parcubacteria group bacterium]
MARRKLDQRNIRKLKRTGKGNSGSFSVTIPIELVRELKWREKQKLVFKKRGKGILILDWEK